MPTVEWFKGKIAHRKRKERYHRDCLKDQSLSPSKMKDHEKKAEFNRVSAIQLEQQQEMEHGERFEENRKLIAEFYAEIDRLTAVNPNDVNIPELFHKIRTIKQQMKAQFAEPTVTV